MTDLTGLWSAARCLALDLLAVQSIQLLAAANIDSMLLKGPATVRQLYAANPQLRSYSDVDLLVHPDAFDAAERTLLAAGYRCLESGIRLREGSWYETAWSAADSDLVVDLHRGFHGVHDSAAFWAQLWQTREQLDLAGHSVAVPDRVGTALLVVLHSVVPGGSPKPLRDLLAAGDTWEFDTWRAAAVLADQVRASDPFRAGIELLPAGRELAARLRLTGPVSPELWLAGRQRSSVSVNLAAAMIGPARGRAGDALQRLLPSAAFLRLHDPRARHSTTALGWAYLRRVGRAAAGAPRAALDLREALWATGVRSEGWRRPRQAMDALIRGDVGALRSSAWAATALLKARAQLRTRGIEATTVQRPPAWNKTARSAAAATLTALRATCLETAVVMQRFDATAGRERDLVIGVTAPSAGFRAHAWLEGDAQRDPSLHEIQRFRVPLL